MAHSQWISAFVSGTRSQDKLDNVRDAIPLRNHNLVKLMGRPCVAVVDDRDISINYQPESANLQGERYGLFYFTVVEAMVPGTLDESKSSTDLLDLKLRVEAVPEGACFEGLEVPRQDNKPDTVAITKARCKSGTVTIQATSSSAQAFLTVFIDGATDPVVMVKKASGLHEFKLGSRAAP